MKNLLFSAMFLVSLSACNMGKHYAGLRLGGSSQSDVITLKEKEEKKIFDSNSTVDSGSIASEKETIPSYEFKRENLAKTNATKVQKHKSFVKQKIVSPLQKLVSTATVKKTKVRRKENKVNLKNDDINSGDPFDVVYWILVVLVLLGGAVAEVLGINFWIGFFLVLIIITGLILLVLWMLDEL